MDVWTHPSCNSRIRKLRSGSFLHPFTTFVLCTGTQQISEKERDKNAKEWGFRLPSEKLKVPHRGKTSSSVRNATFLGEQTDFCRHHKVDELATNCIISYLIRPILHGYAEWDLLFIPTTSVCKQCRLAIIRIFYLFAIRHAYHPTKSMWNNCFTLGNIWLSSSYNRYYTRVY